MLKHFQNRRKKGQSTLEYAILIVIIIAALLSIQVYIKRGVQGRFKSAADDIGDQFSPGNTVETVTTTLNSGSRETFGSGVSRTDLDYEDTVLNVDRDITNINEYWGT